MRKIILSCIFLFVFSILIIPNQIIAQSDSTKKENTEQPDSLKKVYPEQVTTEGSVTINGQDIKYKAIAGTIILTNDKEEQTASIFYAAYFKEGIKDESTRPVMFLYNGGPGSSTLWLHIGAFGPKRVESTNDNYTPPAPYKLVNNEYSLLDVSDLVFIDAPGTGFSKLVGKGKPKDFYGVDEDANAFAQFISNFITKYDRWNSPKFLFGESYGTTRSAVLSNILQRNHYINLNGVILLSTILNFDTSPDEPEYNPGIELPYILTLPTEAATAWYHHKLTNQSKDLNTFLNEAENFAMGDYAAALYKGSELSEQQKHTIAEKLHNYIGLPVDYLEKSDLRINCGQFEKELQSDSDYTTGRLDTRFSGFTMDPMSKQADYDPQEAGIASAYNSLFNQYVHEILKFGKNKTFHVFGDIGKWDDTHKPPNADSKVDVSTNVMYDLAYAMKFNPNLKIMVNSGYFDLATPYYAAVYTMQHLPIPKALQKNIEYYYYKSGHMVYVNPECLKELHDNCVKFIQTADK